MLEKSVLVIDIYDVKHKSTQWSFFCASEFISLCMHVCYGFICALDVRQVKRGRRSCWHVHPIGRVRRARPMKTAQPARTAAANSPSFTSSASTCFVPFWSVQKIEQGRFKWERKHLISFFYILILQILMSGTVTD